ncbi:MAG: hypothetical protein L3J93_04500 [Thermoplasmata archaeon]|nr:hypothetical protein [Thermoplasmata archaeon]
MARSPAIDPGAPTTGSHARAFTSDAEGLPASDGAALPLLPQHSLPVSRSGPAFTGHYYAGGLYAGTNATATSLSVSITVPRDAPDSSDFYYVLLSVWDDAGSYDQVGFTSGNGVWGLTYSTTTPCAGNYSFQTDARNLSPGTTYRFDMIAASGSVVFRATDPSGSPIWSTSAPTGLTHFVLSNLYSCGGSGFTDFTAYEEVYQTIAPVPPYAFYFTNSTADGRPMASWSPWNSSAPAPISQSVAGAAVTIENEPFSVSSAGVLGAEYGAGRSNYTTTVSVGAFVSATTVALSASPTIPNASYSLSKTSGSSPYTSTFTLRVTAATPPGSYPIELTAIEAGGVYARAELLVLVVARLAAALPTFSPPAVDVNESVTIQEQPTGGFGAIAFSWIGLPVGCVPAPYQLGCTPGSTGQFAISVSLTDSYGFRANSTVAILNVSSEMSVRTAASTSSMDIGQTVSFSASVLGGSGGTSYLWSASALASCTSVGATFTCIPYGAGRLTVSVQVQDRNGAHVSSTPVNTTVLSDPTVALAASPSDLDIGSSVTFTATLGGGTGVYAITWIGIPGTCASGTSTSLRCVPTIAGLYSVNAHAKDSNGFDAESTTALVTVYPALVVHLAGSSSSALAGAPITFLANASGGSGRYSISWSGQPSDCASVDSVYLACTSSNPGSYLVRVSVQDDLGGNASTSTTFVVQQSVLGLPALEGYGILGAMTGALALAAILFALRFRRRSPPAPSERPPSG